MSEARPEDWSKLDKIVYLLDHWNEIFDPNTTTSGYSSSDGLGIPLMPLMSRHPSVKELARCLHLLASARPADYRHLKAYRVGAEWRNVDTVRVVKLPSGKRDVVPDRIRQRIVPRWLSQDRVSAAEVWLADHFRGDVFIPQELWGALHSAA